MIEGGWKWQLAFIVAYAASSAFGVWAGAWWALQQQPTFFEEIEKSVQQMDALSASIEQLDRQLSEGAKP